jgi:hypothetical protein
MNKAEHRLFPFITQNWQGKPMVSHQVIVQPIGSATTEKGVSKSIRAGRLATER